MVSGHLVVPCHVQLSQLKFSWKVKVKKGLDFSSISTKLFRWCLWYVRDMCSQKRWRLQTCHYCAVVCISYISKKLPYQVTSTRMEKPSLSSFMAEVSRKEEREGNQRNSDWPNLFIGGRSFGTLARPWFSSTATTCLLLLCINHQEMFSKLLRDDVTPLLCFSCGIKTKYPFK